VSIKERNERGKKSRAIKTLLDALKPFARPIVLISSSVRKYGKIVSRGRCEVFEFRGPDQGDLLSFVERRSREGGWSIDPAVARSLVSGCDGDIRKLCTNLDLQRRFGRSLCLQGTRDLFTDRFGATEMLLHRRGRSLGTEEALDLYEKEGRYCWMPDMLFQNYPKVFPQDGDAWGGGTGSARPEERAGQPELRGGHALVCGRHGDLAGEQPLRRRAVRVASSHLQELRREHRATQDRARQAGVVAPAR